MMATCKRVRLAVVCVYIIACVLIVKSDDVFSSTEQQGELLDKLLVREKRHSLKSGRCDPIETSLGQGLQVLHEIPVRKEKFFIRPRASFNRMTLQLKLDNTFSQSAPKVYGDSVSFSYRDLTTLNSNDWIEVVAEVYKYKKTGPDYWKIRLTVGKDWTREATIYKWWKIYNFDNLVISGEGGCEWTFDCYPDGAVDTAVYEALEFDITDDNWWLVGLLVGAAGLLVVVVAGVWCHKRRKPPSGPGDFISKSISFRKSKNKTTCEEIYEELGSPSLNRLRNKMAGFGDEGSPPPLPAPNPPREGGYTTVIPPQKKMVREVQDQEWYGSLELHSTNGKVDNPSKETEVTSSTLPPMTSSHEVTGGDHSATEPRGAIQNHYSNTPTSASKDSTYVDMRLINRQDPSK